MAGIFGFFDYTKEGPGVDPDGPERGPFAKFFGVLGRKFWKIVTINLFYIVTNLPAIIVAFFVSTIVMTAVFPGLSMETLNELWDPSMLGEGQTAEQLSATILLGLNFLVAATAVGLGFVVVGPSHAGATYLLRNYSREEHAFVWSDFWEHAKKNWKQSTVLSVITTVLFIAVPVAIRFYTEAISNTLFRTLMNTLLIIMFITIAVMIMYAYQMMITFELTLRQVIKNSWLFFVLRLPFNLGILLAQLVIILVIPFALFFFLTSLGMIITIFYFLLFAFAGNLLLVNFFINRQLKRFMIDPMLEEEEEALEADYDYDYDYDEVDEEDEEEEDSREHSSDRDDRREPEPAY